MKRILSMILLLALLAGCGVVSDQEPGNAYLLEVAQREHPAVAQGVTADLFTLAMPADAGSVLDCIWLDEERLVTAIQAGGTVRFVEWDMIQMQALQVVDTEILQCQRLYRDSEGMLVCEERPGDRSQPLTFHFLNESYSTVKTVSYDTRTPAEATVYSAGFAARCWREDEEILYQQADGGDAVVLYRHPAAAGGNAQEQSPMPAPIAFAPDGREVLCCYIALQGGGPLTGGGVLQIGKRRFQDLAVLEGHYPAGYLPDNHGAIAMCSLEENSPGDRVVMLDLDTGLARTHTIPGSLFVQGGTITGVLPPALLTEERWLLLESDPGDLGDPDSLLVYDTATGSLLPVILAADPQELGGYGWLWWEMNLQLSPQGSKVASVHRQELILLDLSAAVPLLFPQELSMPEPGEPGPGSAVPL